MSDTTTPNPVCPLCGEEITNRQKSVRVLNEGRETPAHRTHFDTDSKPEPSQIAEVAEVDRVPDPVDAAPLVVETNDVPAAAEGDNNEDH